VAQAALGFQYLAEGSQEAPWQRHPD